MQVDLITLTFSQPVRGKEARVGYFPSDTLWSALFACDVMLQGRAIDPQSFQVSSAYPYLNGPLLPRPRLAPAGETQDSLDKKQLKNLEYVEWGAFQKLAQGQGLTETEFKQAVEVQKQALVPRIQGETLLDPQVAERQIRLLLKNSRYRYEKPLAFVQKVLGVQAFGELTERDLLLLRGYMQTGKLSSKEERQRNAQDRLTAKTDTFYSWSVWQPRLYFLLLTQEAAIRERLLFSLQVLGDQGLGGLRTQGSGQFKAEVQTCPESLQQSLLGTGKTRILLSLTHPQPAEIQAIQDNETTQYTLIKRDGYMDGHSTTRKSLWMLAEGSVVPGPILGSVQDVRPDGAQIKHPVFRNGQAVSVGV